jgi:hypothetical protein
MKLIFLLLPFIAGKNISAQTSEVVYYSSLSYKLGFTSTYYYDWRLELLNDNSFTLSTAFSNTDNKQKNTHITIGSWVILQDTLQLAVINSSSGIPSTGTTLRYLYNDETKTMTSLINTNPYCFPEILSTVFRTYAPGYSFRSRFHKEYIY